ncbi:hypothetical protein C8Q75DRAFT_565280 [Abortiporus biennis]|nr:hypothetical protein C8Q75DRAFT_565280 [Abortiporus biennis]
MDSNTPNLRVRINQIDYTVSSAGTLDNTTFARAPIIRIYGKSSAGPKACIHIHQVYPYFFVEYSGKTNPDSVNRYIARLTLSLNHAIAVSLKRNPHSPKSQFVRAILLVKGVHFYGFHSSYSPFLKVLMIDPGFVNRAVTILQSGTVMKTRFRVYESHLNYILQFLCDFGLYGCGWIDLAEVWLRGQEEEDQISSAETTYTSEYGFDYRLSSYYRQSQLPLELDSAAHQILNRHRLSSRDIHHKLDIPGPPLPPDPLVISVRELWDDERKRRAAAGLHPSPEIPKDLSDGSRSKGADWVAEARWWGEVKKRIESERGKEKILDNKTGWERWVMTTFESVEALWEKRWKTWKPVKSEGNKKIPVSETEVNPYNIASNQPASNSSQSEEDVDIDETMLSSQAMNSMVEQEEAEWRKLDGNDVQDEDQDEETAEDEQPGNDDSALPDGLRVASTSPSHRVVVSPSKMTPSKRPNSFQNAWVKLAGPSFISTPVEPQTPKSEGASTSVPLESNMLDNEYLATSTAILDEDENPFLDLADNADADLDVIPDQEQYTPGHVSFSILNNHEDQLSPVGSMPDSQRPTKRRKLSNSNDSFDAAEAVSFAITRINKAAPFATFVESFKTNGPLYQYSKDPPTISQLEGIMDESSIPRKVYTDPYYSRESDAPERPREYAGLLYHLKGGTGLGRLEEFNPQVVEDEKNVSSLKLNSSNIYGWEYASNPPSVKEVRRWAQNHHSTSQSTIWKRKASQIVGPTQLNRYGLKETQVTPHSGAAARESGNMDVFSLEVYAPAKDGKVPNPDEDEIVAVFWSFLDTNAHSSDDRPFTCQSGIVVVENGQLNERRLRNWKLDVVESELDVLNRVIDIVHELDPDILVGWEVQAASWGYLSARGRGYGMEIGEQVSRAPGRAMGGGSDQWGLRTSSTFRVIGRHVLNLWRIIRAEQSFTSYTFENAVFQLLRRRTPKYSTTTLASWYTSDVPEHTSRLLRYFAERTTTVIELLDSAEVVTKTAEFARVFGVDFFSVLSRGSQFKVESFMFRIAKPECFVLLSPSRQDVGKQNAAECMPLIMEPLSAFYNSPLVVLDFQSLYPSIMIAYNYCYSTCLGRVTNFKGQNKFGVTELRQPAGLLETLKDHLNIAPNGMIYVKPDVRKGLLARMLTELLDTRVMVKQAIKSVKNDKALRRILDARQLGLKFIANVTYGYTSATFSGRMPAVEIADSIVQSGRETLEKAIRVIDSTKKWGAKVVYGDTDSLFIYLKGKTKEQAFRIGQDMADTITSMNPAPVKLKFEKVYLPCVLIAKKRYVGFKFETPDEVEPTFDAKGIETVRRDGVPAQQKMTETCLKILFRTQDLSKVKEYCCTSWAQILENRASLHDFIFAKEVRMGTYSDKAPPPPGVAVAARRMVQDPNDEPQYGDRIPYVIIRGPPGTRLVDRAAAPEEVLNDSQKHIDATYYISRVLIPPLERVFNLVGADVRSWYDEMPKTLRVDEGDNTTMSPRKAYKEELLALNRLKIDEHFLSSRCFVCGGFSVSGICSPCRRRKQAALAGLLSRVHQTEEGMVNAHKICSSCSSTPLAERIRCQSIDCPWLYERKKLENRAESLDVVEDLLQEIEEGKVIDEDTDIMGEESDINFEVDVDEQDEDHDGIAGQDEEQYVYMIQDESEGDEFYTSLTPP